MTNDYLKQLRHNKNNFIGKHLPWLLDIQKTSLEKFIAQGFPNRYQEDWKYTDLAFLAKKDIAWSIPENPLHQKIALRHLKENNFSPIVFINGSLCSALSKINHLSPLIQCMSLKEMLLNHPEQIANYLKKNEDASALTHLNTALMSDGLFLHVRENFQLEIPIHLLFLSTAPSINTMVNTRNIIVLEKNAQISLFEEHRSFTPEEFLENIDIEALHKQSSLESNPSNQANLFKNTVTDIFLAQDAKLNYCKLQQEHANTIHVAHTNIAHAKNSHTHSHSISLGAKMARDDLHIQLNDTGASCELNGLYVLSHQQHTDHHTRIDHNAANTSSQECYKGILQDRAKGVFNGKIMVHPNAQKTKSTLLNKTLLLSPIAEMNTKPELEIYADDVQCTHGATVGQIEPEQLFYLRSRGLDFQNATKLLMHAFYQESLGKLKNQSLQQYIETQIAEKI